MERAKEILQNLKVGEGSADQVPTLAEGDLALEGAKRTGEQIALFGPQQVSPQLKEPR